MINISTLEPIDVTARKTTEQIEKNEKFYKDLEIRRDKLLTRYKNLTEMIDKLPPGFTECKKLKKYREDTRQALIRIYCYI